MKIDWYVLLVRIGMFLIVVAIFYFGLTAKYFWDKFFVAVVGYEVILIYIQIVLWYEANINGGLNE